MAVLGTLVIVVQYVRDLRPQAPVTGTYLRLRGASEVGTGGAHVTTALLLCVFP